MLTMHCRQFAPLVCAVSNASISLLSNKECVVVLVVLVIPSLADFFLKVIVTLLF